MINTLKSHVLPDGNTGRVLVMGQQGNWIKQEQFLRSKSYGTGLRDATKANRARL